LSEQVRKAYGIPKEVVHDLRIKDLEKKVAELNEHMEDYDRRLHNVINNIEDGYVEWKLKHAKHDISKEDNENANK